MKCTTNTNNTNKDITERPTYSDVTRRISVPMNTIKIYARVQVHTIDNIDRK